MSAPTAALDKLTNVSYYIAMSTSHTAARRGRPPRDETRETRVAILDAALDLFARQGFAGTSVRQIARAVGITEAGIYAHFAGKRALYDALLAAGGPAVILGLLDAGADPEQLAEDLAGADPAVVLRGLARRAMAAWDEPRARRLLSVLIRDGALDAAGQEGSAGLVVAIAQVQRRLAPVFERWIDSGAIRAGVAPDHLVWELFGPLNAIRVLYLHARASDEERRAGHALAERHIDFYLAAVAHAPRERPD